MRKYHHEELPMKPEQLRQLFKEHSEYMTDDWGVAVEAMNEEAFVKIVSELLDQHSPQPVDWPDKPGDWYVEYELLGELNGPVRITLRGDRVFWENGSWNRELAQKASARFLPAHLPTFPPREAD